MNSTVLALIGFALACQAVTIALRLRRARAEGRSGLRWGLLALGIWAVALLALLVTRPVPLASPAAEPATHPAPSLAPTPAYGAPPAAAGMSVYTPFILNGVGLLVLVGLTQRRAGDTPGIFLARVFSLMAANIGMLFGAFVRRESGLAVCYFLVLSAGLLLLIWAISGSGHR